MRRTLFSICVMQALSSSSWAEQTDVAPSTLELDATDVIGTTNYERADGPVQGYRATRSASATRTDTSIHETPQSIMPPQLAPELAVMTDPWKIEKHLTAAIRRSLEDAERLSSADLEHALATS